MIEHGNSGEEKTKPHIRKGPAFIFGTGLGLAGVLLGLGLRFAAEHEPTTTQCARVRPGEVTEQVAEAKLIGDLQEKIYADDTSIELHPDEAHNRIGQSGINLVRNGGELCATYGAGIGAIATGATTGLELSVRPYPTTTQS